MSKIAIIVDSSFAIPLEKRNRYHIMQVSLPIIFGDEAYREESDIQDVAALIKLIDEKKDLPATSQPSPGEWIEALNQAKAIGYDTAILMTLSSGISGSYQTVTNVAASYEGMAVYTWDSRITVIAAGHQALLAATLADQGVDAERIMAALNQLRQTMGVRFAVNDISHLQRTGRISTGQALIGGLLNIKPILSINLVLDGKIAAVGKSRKMSGALKEIKLALTEALSTVAYPVRITVIDANNQKLGDKWQAELQKEYPTIQFERSAMAPSIAVHTGSGAIAVVWEHDWQDLVRTTTINS